MRRASARTCVRAACVYARVRACGVCENVSVYACVVYAERACVRACEYECVRDRMNTPVNITPDKMSRRVRGV